MISITTPSKKQTQLEFLVEKAELYLETLGYVVDDVRNKPNVINGIHVNDSSETISIGIWKMLDTVVFVEQTVDKVTGKFHRRPVTNEVIRCWNVSVSLENLVDRHPELFKQVNKL